MPFKTQPLGTAKKRFVRTFTLILQEVLGYSTGNSSSGFCRGLLRSCLRRVRSETAGIIRLMCCSGV